MFEIKNKFNNEIYSSVTEQEFLNHFNKVTSKEALSRTYKLIKDSLCKTSLVSNMPTIGFMVSNYFVNIIHTNERFCFVIPNVDAKIKSLLFRGVKGCDIRDSDSERFVSIISSWDFHVKQYDKEFNEYQKAFDRMVYNASNEGFIINYDNTLIRPKVYGFDIKTLYIDVDTYNVELIFEERVSFEVNEIYNSFGFKKVLFTAPEKIHNSHELMSSLNKGDVNRYAKTIFNLYALNGTKSIGDLFFFNEKWIWKKEYYTLDELVINMSVDDINDTINQIIETLTEQQKSQTKYVFQVA